MELLKRLCVGLAIFSALGSVRVALADAPTYVCYYEGAMTSYGGYICDDLNNEMYCDCSSPTFCQWDYVGYCYPQEN
ncbi:MAG TPA: hypothetical protein VN690_12670 [Terriglobales bacterium]|nr:hypothetical protein [Terriglobales bacterium]